MKSTRRFPDADINSVLARKEAKEHDEREPLVSLSEPVASLMGHEPARAAAHYGWDERLR